MREKLSFDKGWRFHKGDLRFDTPINKNSVYFGAKTERALLGPASVGYNTGEYATETWKTVDLPHDYVIEGEVSDKYNEALGFFPYENAWYVKKFTLDPADKNKRISIIFDGVAIYATVYLNGCLMKRNFSGYTTFEVDITDIVKFGEENTLSVYVNTENHEGWWYEGGGIYRHVWLAKTSLVSVDLWGVFAKPTKKSDTLWQVPTEVTLRNDTTKPRRASVVGEILDKDGAVVATAKSGVLLREKSTRTFTYSFDINSPSLWSPETPTQYTMRTSVYLGKEVVDVYEVKFGFRTISADPNKGLFINGKYYKINGLCGHADFGLTGKAVPDNIHRHKVALMKEMGANGYRCTHYPQAAELMDALDEAGFIVMCETRWFESTEEGKAQLEMLMKRDRNRPSVMFWSLGNEEPYHETEQGRKIAESLLAYAKTLDDSRFIMTAICNSPETAKVCEVMDVIGVNYNWGAYDLLHEKYPEKIVFSSENCATGTTRGHYLPDAPEKGYITSYDHHSSDLFRSREYTWNFIYEREWLLGGYQWIAFEHRGEATWPRLCSQSGAIDLFMQKKDAFYQNSAFWREEPMVHLLPHWNFRGFEGTEIKVFAYTNTPRVELFLNGESLGARESGRFAHAEWSVPYTPGKLEAVAYDADGNIVARDEKVTSGEAKKLMLTLETKDVRANGEDMALVSCYVVDEAGLPVYDAECEVTFSCNELGRVYSTGSDISDHSGLFHANRRMRAGRAAACVKLFDKEGALKIYATAPGLLGAVISVELTK